MASAYIGSGQRILLCSPCTAPQRCSACRFMADYYSASRSRTVISDLRDHRFVDFPASGLGRDLCPADHPDAIAALPPQTCAGLGLDLGDAILDVIDRRRLDGEHAVLVTQPDRQDVGKAHEVARRLAEIHALLDLFRAIAAGAQPRERALSRTRAAGQVLFHPCCGLSPSSRARSAPTAFISAARNSSASSSELTQKVTALRSSSVPLACSDGLERWKMRSPQ